MPRSPKGGVAKTAAALIIGILLGFAIGSFAGPLIMGGEEEEEIVTVNIGALLPLTGALASYAKRNQYALELAIEDINEFAAATGSRFRFKLLVEDTATDPQTARARIEALAAQGVQVVIGPMSSRSVSAVKRFADANKIVVISQSSTAPALAIPGDYVFRVVPTDVYQGRALAKIVWSEGFTKAAVIYSNDAWGAGLYESFKESFEKLGGRVEAVAYDPNVKEFSGEVAKLADIVADLGPGTAVVLISFEEGIQIIKLAFQNPVLSKVKWFGTDGLAGNSRLANEAGAETVALGGLPSTVFIPARNPLQDEFKRRFKERFGEEPDSYSMNAYDAAWLAALATMLAGEYDGEKIAKALPLVASKYFGITGTIALDENGDRMAGDYGVYQLVEVNGNYEWKLVAIYHIDTDTVEKVEE